MERRPALNHRNNVRNRVQNGALDDHWIINQLFGIITLEQRVSRAISQCDGPVDESVQRQVEALSEWVARFERALDSFPTHLAPSRVSCA
jgi:hypothetical protein